MANNSLVKLCRSVFFLFLLCAFVSFTLFIAHPISEPTSLSFGFARAKAIRNLIAASSAAVVDSAIAPAAEWVKRKIERGDTLGRIWQEYGASMESAERAEKALGSQAMLRHGDEIELKLSDGQILGLKKQASDGSLIVLESNSEREYTSHVIAPQVTESIRTAEGIISSSFSSAATQANVPYSLVDDFVDLFSGRVSFHSALQPGDTFTIQYTERRNEKGDLLSPGPIIAASIKTGGHMFAALRHVGSDNKARFYDEEGSPIGNYFLRYPLQFTRISAVFSSARFHPILKVWKPHNGVDFAAPMGTPVRAVGDGVVEFGGWNDEGGNMVVVQHTERWTTAYLHLSKIAPGLHQGSHVSRGEVIGAVGMTGLATGPHLHFSLYDNGKYVNPLTTPLPQMPASESIPKQYLLATLQTLHDAHVQLEQSLVAERTTTNHNPRA